MKENYIDKAVHTLKENYVSVIIGLIIFLIAFNYISNFVSKDGSFSLDSLLGRSETEKEEESQITVGYVVKEGESLWSIAQNQIGSGYNFVDIARVNNIADPNDIEVGQELIIPDVEPIEPNEETYAEELMAIESTIVPTQQPTDETVDINKKISANKYTVVEGDTLWDISVRAYGDGYQWSMVARANNLSNPHIIHKGNVFVLPRE